MTNKEKILEISKKNNGIVLTKQVTEAKIPRAVLINMVNEKILFPVQRGIYVMDEGYTDPFIMLVKSEKQMIIWDFNSNYMLILRESLN
ncbi:type IV toxin-antitoxin system AbiEi family antitoxin domain-containing protein [Lactococcus taiwanensis]|uniref:type IV toxin-antitoxin system AbiEi family antitoxin domain-containing protein n=1 Tax=Lactococcus taiwanensis TaxID=1151742 RepID=UPI001908D990|nr:type IV toxin-antitoxin system AbiEi family antitoxin domain-containing protein [Lactococcus taiwanensis]